jgi:hypothetical protein
LSGGSPVKLEKAFRSDSGFFEQPWSQVGHVVKSGLLIIALALRWVLNGASPDTWYAMKLVPHEFAFAAVHVVFPPPTSGAPAAMFEGLNWKLFPVTEMFLASHWQPSQ